MRNEAIQRDGERNGVSKHTRNPGKRLNHSNHNLGMGKKGYGKYERARGEQPLDVSTAYREFLVKFNQIKPV